MKADDLAGWEVNLANERDDLISRLVWTLSHALFESRAFLRPVDLQRLASDEADAFLVYLSSQDSTIANKRGGKLCRVGVSFQAVQAFGHQMREFCQTYCNNTIEQNVRALIEDYHSELLLGFVNERERTILEEQEHIRSALQHTLHQYNVQIETAAEVARATVSTLDLDVLLKTAVRLLCQRYELDYVGIYLTDSTGDWLSLKASSGSSGSTLHSGDHLLSVYGNSTVSRSIATVQNILASRSNEQEKIVDSSWVPGTKSEIALPLITGDRVLGALTVQSAELSAFSSLSIAGFQIVTDQLANAIQNANLYADARRRADELAAAYEQLKELEQLKDQFMQNISHELRTPLTMIHGYAELMASNQLGNLDAEQLDAVDVILRYSNALTVLVNDIMAIMEINTAKMANQSVSLAEMLSTSLLDFQVLAAGEGVHLASDIDENDLQPVIYANPDHLRRIVENLIGNAIKFTPAGGMVQVQLDTHDDLAVIQVSDTGIGIPPDMLPHVFDRFFQVDGSRRRRYGGAGLGLALVKELVESYGGWVEADSAGIDRGTTLRVALPTVAQ